MHLCGSCTTQQIRSVFDLSVDKIKAVSSNVGLEKFESAKEDLVAAALSSPFNLMNDPTDGTATGNKLLLSPISANMFIKQHKLLTGGEGYNTNIDVIHGKWFLFLFFYITCSKMCFPERQNCANTH